MRTHVCTCARNVKGIGLLLVLLVIWITWMTVNLIALLRLSRHDRDPPTFPHSSILIPLPSTLLARFLGQLPCLISSFINDSVSGWRTEQKETLGSICVPKGRQANDDGSL